MYVKRDNGDTILDDMREIVERASSKNGAIVVVPTEREVRAIAKNFPDAEVNVMAFADFMEKTWFTENPNAKHYIYGFRIEQMFASLCCGADPECVTVRIPRKKKEEK